MVKKKKLTKVASVKKPAQPHYFMGLNRSQTQALGVAVILTGIVLFALAGYSYTNKVSITRSILPNGAATTATPTDKSLAIDSTETADSLTTPGAGSFGSETGASQAASITPVPSLTPTTPVTPTLTTLAAKQQKPSVTPLPTKEATRQATMTTSQLITKLPNTSSKVTYTVMKNDSLAKIGKQLCGSTRAWLSLIQTNHLVAPYTIQPGQTLIITCN